MAERRKTREQYLRDAERAFMTAQSRRARRAEILESLPSVNNPEVPIYVPRGEGRALVRDSEGIARRATAIRRNSEAEKVEAIGRARKGSLGYELIGGPQADRLNEAMSRAEQRRFVDLTHRIASISNQALGILFAYEGGQSEYNAVLERILASPESRDVEEGLSRLAALASLAERAGRLYAPARVGRIRV